MLHSMSWYVLEKFTDMSVCTGANNSCAGSETGKRRIELVFISMIPMQWTAVVQMDTPVLHGVLESMTDLFHQKKHTTDLSVL